MQSDTESLAPPRSSFSSASSSASSLFTASLEPLGSPEPPEKAPSTFNPLAFADGLEGAPVFDMRPSVCDDPEFPIHLLPCKYLMKYSTIPRHEHLVAQSELVTVTAQELSRSVMKERLIFVSHRWVSGSPDSADNAQLAYIQTALRKFAHFEEMYIWIDYACMKQDAPDLPTIRRLNYILSYATFFMLVLPDFDELGHGYVRRVWCMYEWLASIHFGKIMIVAHPEIIQGMLKITMQIFSSVLDQQVLHYLEQIRLAAGNQIHVMANFLYSVVTPEGMIQKDAFVANLEAFKDEDKLYVYDNVSTMFSLVDILFLFIIGSGRVGATILDGKCTPDGAIILNSFQKKAGGKVNHGIRNSLKWEKRDEEEELRDDCSSSFSDSSLGLGGANWRDNLSSTSSSSSSSYDNEDEETDEVEREHVRTVTDTKEDHNFQVLVDTLGGATVGGSTVSAEAEIAGSLMSDKSSEYAAKNSPTTATVMSQRSSLPSSFPPSLEFTPSLSTICASATDTATCCAPAAATATATAAALTSCWVHHGVHCNVCNQFPITGPRFINIYRQDYDLCSTCEAATRASSVAAETEDGTDETSTIPWARAMMPAQPVSISCTPLRNEKLVVKVYSPLSIDSPVHVLLRYVVGDGEMASQLLVELQLKLSASNHFCHGKQCASNCAIKNDGSSSTNSNNNNNNNSSSSTSSTSCSSGSKAPRYMCFVRREKFVLCDDCEKSMSTTPPYPMIKIY